MLCTKLAEENQEWVELADTISLVREYKNDDIFYDVMHLKPLSHKIVAESIVEILQESGFLN